ncbi:helix-turn-helix domain-containing protein [Streptomyces sp. SID5910]|uniref:helix-turn-helix domain-containing protein n=1 Tax=Streptomyces sp. SID5910 TaxID=2690312 RepID=UPI00136C0EF8|nr:helix-turn-helix domain-containing protein [Streptomyces sp. SID5910]MYR43116.1 hypothetical protein [Streptomyces sp. SID5910]
MSRVTVTDEQIQAAQAGDEAAMWEIVQAFDSMFSGMIRSVGASGASHEEDLLQEARVVLIQHVRSYETGADAAKLTSYVFQAARRRIAEENVVHTTELTTDPTAVLRVRRALWHADGNVDEAWRTLSACSNTKNRMERERFMSVVEALAGTERLDAPVGDDSGGDALTLADVIPDPTAQSVDSFERIDLARWLMTQIPQRQAFALRAFYGVGMTKQEEPETCADLTVKPATLRQLRSRGLANANSVAIAHGFAA